MSLVPDQNFPPDLNAFLSAHGVDTSDAVQPGLSGAAVYRCTSTSGEVFALKRWPAETKAHRIAEVHQVESTARRNGCAFVPQLCRGAASDLVNTYLRSNGAFWELAVWMPGAPLTHDATPQQISIGAAAIAQFHRAVSVLRQQSAPPPAVINRLRRLTELEALLPAACAAKTDAKYSASLRETIAETCSLLSGNWTAIRDRIRISLNSRLELLPTQYVLRDVHREHVLFQRGSVSGLIDFDALRIDTPLTDLSRWGGSFMVDRGDRDAVWQAIMAGYLENYPFQHRTDHGQALALIRELHHSSTWISLANWAVWIRLERRNFAAGDHAVRARIDQLCRMARQEM